MGQNCSYCGCLSAIFLPIEVFAAHFPPMLQRVAVGPGLRTTVAIPLTTPSCSNLETSSPKTTELAPFPLDLGRRQPDEPTVQSIPSASYLGCWVDGSSRIVGAILTSGTDMTPASCRDICFSRSYSVFGVEAAAWCLCDTTISKWAVRTAEADCSHTCKGNAVFVCGADWRINIYSQTPLLSATPSSGTISSLTPSTPTSTIQPPSSFSNVTAVGMSPREIAGISIGSALGVAAVAILAIYLLFVLPRKRKKQATTVYNRQLNYPSELEASTGMVVVQELPVN